GDGKGYISADGAVEEIPVDERGEPVGFSGITEDGVEFDSSDIAGDVTVVTSGTPAARPAASRRRTSRRSGRSTATTTSRSSASTSTTRPTRPNRSRRPTG